ncbi:SIS domain-containing protein [Luteipulveratus halotolerans]|uniref:Glucosamine-6-phosphate deaminase n=1 Tax=Luteipulveratus halotolerans TaxID=1631356 RepID=A0A0L6CKW9_9MICO|nr:SIS domain-containing protein [Luteipulveratus halotolerans]KNX38168.1 glucosamine-6-phosphate deaminase [Luteipulveratus halotolerans]
MTTPGHLMAAEIAEQPTVLAHILSSYDAHLSPVLARLRAHDTRSVLLVARGTSDHAAIYAKYLIETRLGLPVGLVSTSTYTAYDAQAHLDGVVWIAVSQSGGSPDLVESTEKARAAGALTIALTNADGSPLEAAAELRLPMLAGVERSVAATKTYTASLQWLWLLVEGWAGGSLDAAAGVPDWVAGALDRPEVSEVASRYRFVERLVTTSRGFAYPTARESALKLMETCYLSAHAFSGADLLHGPLAMIDEDRPVVVICPDGAGGRALQPVLEQLDARGADVCLVAPPEVTATSAARIPLPSGMIEQLAPIAQVVPLQQLALQLALSRHYDPDRPRGLQKVTKTT